MAFGTLFRSPEKEPPTSKIASKPKKLIKPCSVSSGNVKKHKKIQKDRQTLLSSKRRRLQADLVSGLGNGFRDLRKWALGFKNRFESDQTTQISVGFLLQIINNDKKRRAKAKKEKRGKVVLWTKAGSQQGRKVMSKVGFTD